MSTAGDDPLQARIEELRSKGAERVDPLRLLQLQALATRLAGQPQPVRALLQEKIESALASLAARLEHATAAASPLLPAPQRAATTRGPRALCEPLARLNDEIRDAPQRHRQPTRAPGTRPRDELASVSRFRRSWSAGRAQERVIAASLQRPANAGPLNSHALILQSLELMQALPADYLRRFVAYAESLVWLEQVGAAVPAAAATESRAGTRSRSKDKAPRRNRRKPLS